MNTSYRYQSRPKQTRHLSRGEGCVSILESIKEIIQTVDDKLRSQCSDDPNSKNRKSKKGNRTKLPIEKMTSGWGPTHSLDDSDDVSTTLTPIEKRYHLYTPESSKERGSDNGTPDTLEITPERADRSRIFASGSGFYSVSHGSQCSKKKASGKFSSATASLGKIMGNASAVVSSGMNALRDSRSSTDLLQCTMPTAVFESEQDRSVGCEQFCAFPESDYDLKETSSKLSAFERRKHRHDRQRAEMEARQYEQEHSRQSQSRTPQKAQNSIWQSQDVNNQSILSLHKPPLETFTINKSDYMGISESVSELTMRSSYGEAIAPVGENRRMAYYAVGKRHDSMGRNRGGGNRRCYFSGKLIVTGNPFYAGSVQQGLRTLVVFCLPSALGLPKTTHNRKKAMKHFKEDPTISRLHDSSFSLDSQHSLLDHEQILHDDSTASINSDPALRSTNSLTSVDISLSDEDEELRLPKSALEREALLRSLPEPNQDLLNEMNARYPEQFSTLPVQVRGPNCWRLFVRFCFFSGLPIAEGELHYKVKDEIVQKIYGEEIILSHEVMEAVNGEESADILRLPNKKTFKYLKKHYILQCGKLTEEVFDRRSWEIVLAEI